MQKNNKMFSTSFPSLIDHFPYGLNKMIGFRKEKYENNKEIKELMAMQDQSRTYEEWKNASEKLDILLGNNKWKSKEISTIYDYKLVRYRKESLQSCRKSGDMKRLLFMVRTQLERNVGNMGDIRLYNASHTGTKNIIEDYISECELCLQTLLDYGETGVLSEEQLLDTLIQTRKTFGRTALVLSGGSILGLLHIGVMRELLHSNLLPRIVSGSSAGSIFASVLCIHFDHEIDELFNTLINEKFDIFEETGNEESFFVRLARFLKHGTILDNKYLASTLQKLLGNMTFQEAYNRTRKILNVTVSPASVYESARILNYLTAPNVLIWSAVCASCSVPFVFPSYTLLAKDHTTGDIHPWSPSPLKYIDGSVDNDLPLSRLSELFNVNHFIACQVNPHVVPFVRMTSAISSIIDSNGSPFSKAGIFPQMFSSRSNCDNSNNDNYTFNNLNSFLTETQAVITDEISHYLYLTHELGVFKNLSSKFRSVISQQYTGDITIVPHLHISELNGLFKNPTKETFLESHLRGQKAIWPNLTLIRNHCAIELALDKSIHKLRTRMIPLERSSLIISRSNVQNELGKKSHYSTANLKTVGYSFLISDRSHGGTTLATQENYIKDKGKENLINNHHHIRRKSEETYSSNVLIKRKSSQDFESIIYGVTPTQRTSRSPTMSRKGSYKNINFQ